MSSSRRWIVRIRKQWQSLFSALVLAAVVSTALIAGPVAVSTAQAQGTGNNGSFIVRQGSTCTQVQPLGNGSQSVSSFYDYRSTVTDKKGLYSSYGTRDIQQPNTSQVFVYNGSDGLSLVFLTDKLGSASAEQTGGGSTYTSNISGLPPNGKWVVEDDRYTHNDDIFQTNLSGGRRAHFVQVQNGNRTDGAAFLGLGSTNYRAIHIRIYFNQHSAIYPYENWQGSPAQNRIANWIVRSGDGTTTSLNMNRPITIAPGTCAGGIQHPNRSSTTPIGANETAIGSYIPSSNDTPATKNPSGPPLTEPTSNSTAQQTVTTTLGGTSTAMTDTAGTNTSRPPATTPAQTTTTPSVTHTETTAPKRITTASSANETTNTTRTGGPTGMTEQASGGNGSGNGSGSGGGSGAFGPGFDIGIALVSVLVLGVVALARRSD